MKALLIGLIIIAGYASSSSLAADTYLCVVDAMTGFSIDKNTNRWRTTNFTAEKKVLFTRSKSGKVAWEVTEVGSSLPDAVCEKDFNEGGNLFCSGLGEYKLNKQQLRFLYVYPFGYWDVDNKSDLFKEGRNTPAMGIGKCSPL